MYFRHGYLLLFARDRLYSNDNICRPTKKEKEKKKENSDTTSKQREVLLSFPSYKTTDQNILLDEGEDETTVTVPSHIPPATRLCMTVRIQAILKTEKRVCKIHVTNREIIRILVFLYARRL
jgi:hypothetical protein